MQFCDVVGKVLIDIPKIDLRSRSRIICNSKMMSLKINSFDFNLNESEQDANSALTDLDKGLRSTKTGEQCEAIVKFPRLFEKYPFPILINASFLKLADTFHFGNNFLRCWILKVCEQSEKHIDKILNVDEFVKRIFSVIHSNDPIARAITLKTFAAVVCIVPERQQIHHAIRESLDSNDPVEVEAAIYAAMRFASYSKTFAVSMCSKISNMIQGLTTPYNMKLKLIPILQYMHHDSSTASMVRKLLIDLISDYSSTDFVIVTLHCLTKLAAATLTDIPNQVNLLVSYLKKECHQKVKVRALKGLLQMASQGAHLWPDGALDSMLEFVLTSQNENFLLSSLDVIDVLLNSPVICLKHYCPDSKVRVLCQKVCLSSNLTIATKASNVLMKIFIFCRKEGILTTGFDDFIVSLESLLLLLINLNEECRTKELKTCLYCLVSYCRVEKDYCESLVDMLSDQLVTGPYYAMIHVSEALSAIASFNPEMLAPHLLKFVSVLNQVDDKSGSSKNTIIVMLCTLIFQAVYHYDWTDEILEDLRVIIKLCDLWTSYRILRNAMRYCHYQVANMIQEKLINDTSLENFHFWFESLDEICKGELLIQNEDVDIVKRLKSTIQHYNKAIIALKAANSSINVLNFHYEYVKLRCEFLTLCLQTVHTTKVLCTVPPPAIASTMVQTSRDDLQRNGMIISQLRKRSTDFKSLSDSYWKLYQSSFDADPSTLENIQSLHQACNLLGYNVDRICSLSGRKEGEYSFQFLTNINQLENQKLVEICKQISKLAYEIELSPSFKPANHEQVESLHNQIKLMSLTPLSFARFYFQSLQTTTIKLALSPQPRTAGESISVPSGSQLAVKVEGVILHGQKPGLFRKIHEIVINVSSQLQSKTTAVADVKDSDNNNITMTQTVTPHHDFFSAQFLLAFTTGQHSIVVEILIVDETNNTWNTGIKSTLNVKLLDDIQSVSNWKPTT